MALAGLSTLGVKFGYKAGATQPDSFTELTRINSIGGISLSTEAIDASALVDEVTRRVAGRADTDETLPVTINATDETIAEWEGVITAFNGLTTGQELWFEVYHPRLTKGFFFKAEPPKKLPMPEMGQNQLLTMEINLVVTEYVGMATAVEPA
ncbi:MAG: hypothetical protein IKO36_08240 [Bacteroidaceae bacterium]|nr:hypothetical protein [Bacteroidaceae bacterium]